MNPKERIIAFPRMGKKNMGIFREYVESLGLKVLPNIPTTDKTIKLGVKHSPDMMCFPYKVTLGNYIESLENGANTLLMFNSRGTCRLSQYHKLHKFTLENLGYEFEMQPISLLNLLPAMSKLSGKSFYRIGKEFLRHYKKLKEEDGKFKEWSSNKPNIGIIGEVYCACDEVANHDLERKIINYGGNPINTARAGDFLLNHIKWNLRLYKLPFINKKERTYIKKSLESLSKRFGGHAKENLISLYKLVEKDIEGVIHVLPLSCMPESTIEVYINKICSDNKIPMLRIYLDENNSEANLETRLETFVELIKWKRQKKDF
jgi:predicted nucleotide-binding protein (sugar kinase/HSP70/actin superfamily)